MASVLARTDADEEVNIRQTMAALANKLYYLPRSEHDSKPPNFYCPAVFATVLLSSSGIS